MNKGNLYIFIYSVVMVVIVAILLSAVAMGLKPAQDKNVEIEKKQNILASVRIIAEKEKTEELYEKYIAESFVINTKGEVQDGVVAFDVSLKEELAKSVEDRFLPVYVFHDGDKKFYIVPTYGKGLWGPIWGYLSFEPDFNTIYGVTFDHKGETPGLGAEINQDWFQKPFEGKQIFDETGKFVSVMVVKGKSNPDSKHEVDAISGGTITSKGLEAMLKDCLVNYQTFFKSQTTKE
ncbi:MAG: NADH:ubiquinone reductase (Na(+)-transporting) subunit C [Bacteroidetes bacterium GWF2_38_335]|nr:MAG: NADH:ubiquinone reductase (Na(+)-transporting) subunit C [Bacteroidetes bacterium GWF2_38_335]OFY80527.1 MAG: NADH:ubiquinone reductase (Na(+)-transporting) subunit C [Bacteroidetes bacterium RIFOXYA12_FULL_38_20]HBS85862.1 NADH:ubiquinone reductase (Na(+)-transporting) subunit C [Bacteroidales bacterium]